MSWPSQYTDVFTKLRGVKDGNKPNEWYACCPAHDDSRPSLTVAIATDGRLLVNCHANKGCDYESIKKAMGLEDKHFFPSNGDKGKLVKVYDYTDDHGRIIFQCCRWEPKDFNQRRPNPDFDPKAPEGPTNKKWVWNLEGVQRVLYRHVEFKKALAERPDRIVFVVEGEKDVDALWAMGIAATTSPMGAGKWRPEFAEVFGKENIVVVIADNDDAGRAHALDVCNSIFPKVKRVILISAMPGVGPGGDLSEWLDKQPPGNVSKRRAALSELVKVQPAWRPPAQVGETIQKVGERAKQLLDDGERVEGEEQLLELIAMYLARIEFRVQRGPRESVSEVLLDFAARLSLAAETWG